MCGIAAIAVGKSYREKRVPYPMIKNMTQELLVSLSSRGMDASGIAIINENQSFIYKKPLKPSRLVVRPRFQELLDKIGPDTNFILLHSRAASVGGNSNNFNNHPIVSSPIIGIHNGTLYNAKALFKRYKKKFKPQGDVDSEIIFKLLDMHLKRGVSLEKAMMLTSKELLGAFTGASVNINTPNKLLLFKFGRQLSFLKIPHYDMLVAVSETRFYDAVCSKIKFKPKDICLFPKEGTGFVIDVNAGKIEDNISDFKLNIDSRNFDKSTAWNNWANFIS